MHQGSYSRIVLYGILQQYFLLPDQGHASENAVKCRTQLDRQNSVE